MSTIGVPKEESQEDETAKRQKKNKRGETQESSLGIRRNKANIYGGIVEMKRPTCAKMTRERSAKLTWGGM